jgi:hypothetical protein
MSSYDVAITAKWNLCLGAGKIMSYIWPKEDYERGVVNSVKNQKKDELGSSEMNLVVRKSQVLTPTATPTA